MTRILWVLALLACLAGAACGDRGEPERPDGAAEAAEPEAGHPPRPRGRPLPAFSGYTLDERAFDVSSLLGRRLLIFFFNPEIPADARPVAEALRRIEPLRVAHNFEIVGVATGSSRARALAFAKELRLDFPVLDDSSARLAGRFGLREPLAVLGVDAEGYVSFGTQNFGTREPVAIEEILRRSFRLPREEADAGQPPAPAFRAAVLDGGEPFDLEQHRGEPVALIFFLHTCPHCHAALRAFQRGLEALPEDRRPLLLGIEISGRTASVRQQLKDMELDFFPVVFDDDGSIQRAYGVYAGVPEIFLIDRKGRIVFRNQGWEDARDEAPLRMRLAKLGGARVPMLLRTNGYSGSEVCGVCHELERETWRFTSHAGAFDTLVRHGSDADPECVSCHVVGHGKPGGFVDSHQTSQLEDVGCESCHGRGGPHLSPDFVKDGSYETACLACHDTKHSLGFDYATFRPRISHLENAALLSLPPEEKRARLAALGRPGGSLLPTDSAIVGSEACAGCHPAEYATWKASDHASAGQTLARAGKAEAPDCLRCHTTGFERPGGFPAGAALADHEDLGRVGCESCHGPGGKHVEEGRQKLGSILSLGDKCDSCVILQICGACHDEANDPRFPFEVEAKIEKQRHGTIEPGTGKPKEGGAARRPPDAALLATAFAALGEEG